MQKEPGFITKKGLSESMRQYAFTFRMSKYIQAV